LTVLAARLVLWNIPALAEAAIDSSVLQFLPCGMTDTRLPAPFRGNLALPVLGSPMFICSYPELVLAQCKAGVIGCFPSLNARPTDELTRWLTRIETELAAHRAASPGTPTAPYGVNLIVHRSNARLEHDLRVCAEHRVPFVITSVGDPTPIVRTVHAYGGIVFHDVTTVRHARKAIDAGVDGLILVCAGAGGHAGTLSPFALLPEMRAIYDGPLVLAGAISNGAQIRAAQMLGADLVYIGTRFIATREANAAPAYKQLLVEGQAADIVYTPYFTGIPGNYLRHSIEAAGIDPRKITADKLVDIDLTSDEKTAKAWKEIWSAGQGIGAIHDVPAVADLVARLIREYDDTPLPQR
jgi:nitronate monooxygenase